jgi:hypothetical protein
MHCGKPTGGKALLALALTPVCNPKRGWLLVAFALVLAGCGASVKPHHAVPPQPSQDRMKAVVRVWEANLNAGNNAAEARLFSLPALISLMEGPYGCLCLTRAEVVQFHAQLLCSGKIVSIKVRGRYATAVFRALGDRETSKCDYPGHAHRGAVHDRARQDHRVGAGVVEGRLDAVHGWPPTRLPTVTAPVSARQHGCRAIVLRVAATRARRVRPAPTGYGARRHRRTAAVGAVGPCGVLCRPAVRRRDAGARRGSVVAHAAAAAPGLRLPRAARSRDSTRASTVRAIVTALPRATRTAKPLALSYAGRNGPGRDRTCDLGI